MIKLILPIYKYFLLRKFRDWKLPEIDLYKLAIHLALGLAVIGSMTPTFSTALYAQEVSNITGNSALQVLDSNAPIVNSYIQRTGYASAGMPNPQFGSYQWVTATHRLSRGYSGGHAGLDVDGEFGDPIYAMTDGVVREVSTAGPYGNKIIIDHAGDVSTLYAHLQRIAIEPGQTVSAGTFIGEMGSTGRSTGSHLHFEVRKSGQLIDPATLSYF